MNWLEVSIFRLDFYKHEHTQTISQFDISQMVNQFLSRRTLFINLRSSFVIFLLHGKIRTLDCTVYNNSKATNTAETMKREEKPIDRIFGENDEWYWFRARMMCISWNLIRFSVENFIPLPLFFCSVIMILVQAGRQSPTDQLFKELPHSINWWRIQFEDFLAIFSR